MKFKSMISEKKSTLKTTAAVGGGQIITILSGIIKTKVAALILGPSGIGVLGLLTIVADMIRSLSSIGIPLSGVREISVAESSLDKQKINLSIEIFNKWIVLTAILGTLVCALLSFPLSFYLFKNYNYGWEIFFLGLAVFFSTLSAGRLGVLQGKRAISSMIKAGLYGNILSAVFSIALYYFFKEAAIVPSLILTGLLNYLTAVYFYKKSGITYQNTVSYLQSFPHAKEMIKVGFFIVIVSVFDQVMSILLRSFITDRSNTDGLGLFTAATTIAGMYLTIVLTSLSSDYLPKLAALTENKAISNAVNLQLNIIVLLASPIIIGMVGFSDLMLKILYSNDFVGANRILQWQILGDFFKIISWPCGFIFLAKGFGKQYTVYSISYSILYFVIIILGWDYVGFSIIGISFFIAQLAGLVFTYTYFYHKFQLKISYSNLRIILIMGVLISSSFLIHNYIRQPISYVLNSLIVLISVIISFVNLTEDFVLAQKIKNRFKS